MRVGIDFRPVIAAPYSGIGRQAKAIHDVLNARDDTDCLCFSLASTPNNTELKINSPEGEYDAYSMHHPKKRWLFEAKYLPRVVREQKLDVYIVTPNQGIPIGKKPREVKYVLQLHDLFQVLHSETAHRSRLKKAIYRLIDKVAIGYAIKQADVIWCPSDYTRQQLIAYAPEAQGKTEVLPNLVPVSDLRDPESEQNKLDLPASYWLIVGLREPRKNIPWFLNVWNQQKMKSKQLPDLVLLGHQDDVPDRFRRLAGIHFMNGVTDSALQQIYRDADYLWQPSYDEGFGLPVIEALAHGTDVVTARGSALDEITPPWAQRFDPYDSDALAALMISVAAKTRDDNLLRNKEWAQRYDLPAYQNKLNLLFDRLLHG